MSAAVLDLAGGRERFAREAELARRLDHPGVVRVLDAGIDGGLLFTALELLEGESLEQRLTRGPMPPREAARVVDELLAGLEAAHAANVLHRDIKPANLFLCDRPGQPPQAKILDFGVAKSTNPNTVAGLTKDGISLGTPAYMAPEHLAGVGLGPGCDLFALGLVLAELLLGRPVYGDHVSAIDVVKERLSGARAPIPPELLATPLGHVIAHATTPDPSQRTSSASGMRQELARAVSALPADAPASAQPLRPARKTMVYATLVPDAPSVAAPPLPVVAAAPKAAGSKKGLALVVAIVVLLLAGVGGWVLFAGGAGDARSAASDTEEDQDDEPAPTKKKSKSSASATPSASALAPSAAPTASAAQANEPFKPLDLAVGQWIRMRVTTAGAPSEIEYRVVDKEGEVWVLENHSTTGASKVSAELKVVFGDRTKLDKVELRSARVKVGGRVIDVPAQSREQMLGFIAGMAIAPFDPARRADVTVPGGTFARCYVRESKGTIFGIKLDQVTYAHPTVPINGQVKSEGTVDGKPSVTELIAYGLSGAKREF